MKKSRLLVLTGPTAIGKSNVAIKIALMVDGEIVSADSMQVYKRMDIGTAKPYPEDLRKVPHHLIDIVCPDQEFSVAEYQGKARQAIAEISQRKKLPILVGGSGLYIRAAIDKLEFPGGTRSSKIRKSLQAKMEQVGPEELHRKLKELDPKAAANIHPGNTRRVIRALEVIESTGYLFSDFQKEWLSWESIYEVVIVALRLPRNELYAKIDARVDKMISDGLVEEVQDLVARGYREAITSRQALGYRQVLDYLENKISPEECTGQIKQNSRNFAKRQLTWIKRDPRIHWMDTGGKSVELIAREIIDYLRTKEFLSG